MQGNHEAFDGLEICGDFDEEFSGNGKFKYSNGMVVKGKFVKGKPYGDVIVNYVCGQKFEGELFRGKRKRGKLYTESGMIFDGDWENDQLVGNGKIFFTNGKVYVGEVRGSKANGKGKLIFRNEVLYSGFWVDNNLVDEENHLEDIDGIGESGIVLGNGIVYRGEVRDNKAHGRGKMIFANKIDMVFGEFEDGQIVSGVRLSKEFIYIGNFKNSTYHGQGIYVKMQDLDGKSYLNEFFKGKWTNGVHRKGVHFLGNQFYRKGRFINKLMHGHGLEIFPISSFEYHKNVISTANYLNDFSEEKVKNHIKIVSEMMKIHFERRYKGDFKNGIYHGYGAFTNLLNDIAYIGWFKNGNCHGKGVMRKENFYYSGDFNNGKRHGFAYQILGKNFTISGDLLFKLKNKIEKYLDQLQSLPTDLKESEYFQENINQKYSIYIGEFTDDLVEGVGVYINTDTYKGEFRNDSKFGHGEIFKDHTSVIVNLIQGHTVSSVSIEEAIYKDEELNYQKKKSLDTTELSLKSLEENCKFQFIHNKNSTHLSISSSSADQSYSETSEETSSSYFSKLFSKGYRLVISNSFLLLQQLQSPSVALNLFSYKIINSSLGDVSIIHLP